MIFKRGVSSEGVVSLQEYIKCFFIDLAVSKRLPHFLISFCLNCPQQYNI